MFKYFKKGNRIIFKLTGEEKLILKGITEIVVKILSIYFVIEFITEGIPQIFGIFYSGQSMRAGMIAGIIIAQLLKFIIAVYLWYSADMLSNFILGNIKENALKDINYKKLQSITFSVVGIVLLAINIPDLVQFIMEYLSTSRGAFANALPKLIANIAKVIIGFWLLIGSSKIVKFIQG